MKVLYQKITADTFVTDVMKHPVFDGHGRLIFPWDDKNRYPMFMMLKDVPSLHLWHTNMNVDDMVAGVNHGSEICWF